MAQLPLIICFCMLPLVSGADAYWGDARDAAVHQELDRAITPQPRNEHLARLSALRALQDPRLEPLLASLLDASDPAIQIHALLGLADLQSDRRLDLERVLNTSATARESIIMLGVKDGRLTTADMHALLSTESLAAGTQLMLLASLLETDELITAEQIAAVEVEPATTAAATRAALLANLGREEPIEAMALQLRTHPEDPATQNACFAALEQSRQLPSAGVTRLAWACLKSGTGLGLRRYAMLILLETRAEGIMDAFASELNQSTRRRHQVDLALLLMMTGTTPPDAAMQILRGDELLSRMTDASIALGGDPADAVGALERLIDIGHRRTVSWVLDSSTDWPDSLATPLLERILDLAIAGGLKSAMAGNGVLAASSLLQRAPERFRTRLSVAEDDGIEQQLLLLAMLQEPVPDLVDTVASIRRIGIAPPDVLALLVLARDQDTITPADVATLELIATGSSASEALRTQAAWLAVRHTGVVDDVMASLLRPTR
jgi:hypothetical protein